MKPILINSLFRQKSTSKLYRVCWTDTSVDIAVYIHTDYKNRKARFRKAQLSQLAASLADVGSDFEAVSGASSPGLPVKISEVRKKRREERYKLIESIVCQMPPCFEEPALKDMVLSVAEMTGTSTGIITSLVHRYFKGGATPYALHDDYDKSGKARDPDSGKRRGPKGTMSEYVFNQHPDHISAFRAYFEEHFFVSTKPSFSAIFKFWTEAFFVDFTDENGIVHSVDLADIPTERQGLIKLYELFPDKVKNRRARSGSAFDRNERALDGEQMKGVHGPGILQVDSTTGDIYLISMINRQLIVGRPLVYLLSDVFSRCIVGFHVSLGKACYAEAIAAIYSTVQDRAELIDQLGIDIPEDFLGPPIQPSALVVDNAEVARKILPDKFFEILKLDVSATPAYRPDLKGVVESDFKWIVEHLKNETPGWVLPDFTKRGSHDYRYDAIYNLREFTEMVASSIRVHNNEVLEDYPLTRDMIADGVEPRPIKLLEWGIQHRSGSLRPINPEKVFFALMPEDKATVTRKGIFFRETHYTCKEGTRRGWFEAGHEFSLKISYDRRNCNSIWLHVEGSETGYVQAFLHPEHKDRENMTFDEIEELNFRAKPTKAAYTKARHVSMNEGKRLKNLKAKAQAEKEALGPDLRSKTAQVADIRENQRKEHRATAPLQSPLASKPLPFDAPKAAVLPLRPSTPKVPATVLPPTTLAEQARLAIERMKNANKP